MRPQFSEFSFSYALTESLMRRIEQLAPGAKCIPPRFYTQNEEAKIGADVRITYANRILFLQFKTCNGMVRESAKENSKYHLSLNLPFLRMNLMPRKHSCQHDLLVDLERKKHDVYYAAPRYYEFRRFHDLYDRDKILTHSAFIRPGDIGRLPDNEPHHVSFESSSQFGWFLSEPRGEIGILFGEQVVNQIVSDMKDRPLPEIGINATFEVIQDLLGEERTEEYHALAETEGTPIERLTKLSMRHLGALPIFLYGPERQRR